jgi:hypothetical protein
VPAVAQVDALATCITGQILCNKVCGKGPDALPCINLCGTKAQACVQNGGRWEASAEDEDERPAKPSSRRESRVAEPEEDEADSSRSSSSKSSSRVSTRTDGKCNGEAKFMHSWPVDKGNDNFKFKFRVSSDDCGEYSCRGYVHYRIHYDWRSGGSNSKSTLVGYTIPKGQRSVEVTDETFPSGASMAVDVRDVEIGEISCSSP